MESSPDPFDLPGQAPPEGPPAALPQIPARSSLRRELSALALLSLVAVGIAFFLRLYVAQAYEIRGRSMLPTYHDGDKVLLLKLAPTLLPVARDDIVIFTHPSHPDRDLVKRVVGISRDRVHMDERGSLYVNGVRIEPLCGASSYGRARSRTWEVPENSLFVLGDNRGNSQDSRDFGFVPMSSLKGKVWFRWWPLTGHAEETGGEREE